MILQDRKLKWAEINKYILTEFLGMLLGGRKCLFSQCIGMQNV